MDGGVLSIQLLGDFKHLTVSLYFQALETV